MATIDIAILVIIGVSAIISFFRGFLREALSVLGWMAAFGVAFYFSGDVAGWLAPHIEGKSLRLVLTFLLLFIATLIVSMLVGFLAGKLVKSTGQTGSDRMIGVLFGVIRGLLVVLALVLLAGFTNLPQEVWWMESMFVDYFEQAASWLRTFLPADIAGRIRY